MKYDVKFGNPREFYHESHRAAHFLNFSEVDGGNVTNIDFQNVFD